MKKQLNLLILRWRKARPPLAQCLHLWWVCLPSAAQEFQWHVRQLRHGVERYRPSQPAPQCGKRLSCSYGQRTLFRWCSRRQFPVWGGQPLFEVRAQHADWPWLRLHHPLRQYPGIAVLESHQQLCVPLTHGQMARRGARVSV